MATGTSAAQANAMIDALFTGSTYVQLHIGDPGAAGTSNVSAMTTRKAVTFAASSGGSKAATGSPVATWTMGATETITHISFWSALTSGTFRCSLQLPSPVPVASSDPLNLLSYSYAMAPIAA